MEKIFSFKILGKKYKLKVKECKSFFLKGKGLIFSKNSCPLLFIFKKETNNSIHSFFCRPFIAIWFNETNIVDIRSVKSWEYSIKPKRRYNKLLEIPINNENYKTILDGMRKI